MGEWLQVIDDQVLSLSGCVPLDLTRSREGAQEQVAASLAALSADSALLLKTRDQALLQRHHPGWLTFDIIEGPAAFHRVFVRSTLPARVRFPAAIAFHQHFQTEYRRCISLATTHNPEAREVGASLGRELADHLRWEEAALFPPLSAFLGEERLARELGYELQGLRAALARWPAFLETCLTGAATRKEVERFELDMLHLFEHHVRREEQAVYPILNRLS